MTIPYTVGSDSAYEPVDFAMHLETSYIDDPDNTLEDVIVFVVGDISDTNKVILRKRALPLRQQDEVDNVLDYFIETNQNIRVVGFPHNSKCIDYEKQRITAQPRGFYGKIRGKSEMRNCYDLKDVSWKEGSTNGFSGSPIISLILKHDGTVDVSPVGIYITVNKFISINIATNLIAKFIENRNSNN